LRNAECARLDEPTARQGLQDAEHIYSGIRAQALENLPSPLFAKEGQLLPLKKGGQEGFYYSMSFLFEDIIELRINKGILYLPRKGRDDFSRPGRGG